MRHAQVPIVLTEGCATAALCRRYQGKELKKLTSSCGVAVTWMVMFAAMTPPAWPQGKTTDLTGQSLEDLMSIEVTSVSKTEQKLPLAVLDWVMPGLEGPQVCQRVREHPDRPYIYILLLTACSQKGDLLRGLESGADDYLTKPFDAQELRARLRVGQRILDLQDSLIAAREELRFRATHDVLTGIANRGVVLDAINRERSRQIRDGGPFGIILLDLDHFKSVNDTRGHLAGDVTDCVRPYDHVGRYDGEEFLVVAPSSDGFGTQGLAERIRTMIQSRPVMTDAGPVNVTASCGVAVSIREKPVDAHALLLLADEALYRAKEHGRNRSEFAVPGEVSMSDPETSQPERVDS
jgi:diguanylate cyclase (GGDEF)-like protein